jgi:hypothetical protein
MGSGKGKDTRMKRMEVHYIYTYEDSIMKPTKHCLKRMEKRREKKVNEGGKPVQSTLYTSMELSQ